MRLAEFATPEIYTDFWTSFTPVPVMQRWIFIGATYNNGDDTDSWCSNFAVIPNNIITNKIKAYEDCKLEFKTQRLVIDEARISDIAAPEDMLGAHVFACSPL
jgi:hypothetical protein